MTRHELRYKTMTILYQAFLYENNNIEYNIDNIISEQLDGNDKFVSSLVNGVISKKIEIDELANKKIGIYLD